MFNFFRKQRSPSREIGDLKERSEIKTTIYKNKIQVDALQSKLEYEINELRREIGWLKDQVKEIRPNEDL